ncbi:hypothetical protein R3P38DRAFT_1638258 [Favolaschia claudopus]|uniref:Uncharacterized protein n=1 Tax=Favolaschia claudopus TaxID=2862362 RepID=A0AAW0DKF2_9AGAR
MKSDPAFPAELEREIFETTAVLYPSTIPALLLVARRIFVWIEPLLYRVIRTDVEEIDFALQHARETKPASFFHRSVRHLYIGSRGFTGPSLLPVCPDILSLAYISPRGQPALLEAVQGFRNIRRWSGSLVDLFDGSDAVSLNLPVFETVTHLDVFDDIDVFNQYTIQLCASLTALPALTHLCLNKKVPSQIIRSLLSDCSRLQVFVIMWSSRVLAEAMVERHRKAGLEDPRFVVAVCDDYWADWEVGARGGVDFWAAAEAFVARKRSREIEGSRYLLEDW